MQRRRRRKGLAGLLSVAIVLLAIGVMVNSSFSAGQYYRTVGETTAGGDELVGEKFRVAGKVVNGSVVVGPGAAPDYSFKVSDETGGIIPVHYAKAVPDTFREGVDVVVEGQLVRPDLFEASHVIAKCPSKYESSLTPEDIARKEAAVGKAAPTIEVPGAEPLPAVAPAAAPAPRYEAPGAVPLPAVAPAAPPAPR